MKNNFLDKKKHFRTKQLSKRKKLISSVSKIFDENLFDQLYKKIN